MSLPSSKLSSPSLHCTSESFVEMHDGQEGFILAAQQDKFIINVYNFQKEQLTFQIVLPKWLSCITMDLIHEASVREGRPKVGNICWRRVRKYDISGGPRLDF
ncbi:hypothetical protein CY34DRAFT_805216 [Suillus luteus UH-Slu-Lm8-n1]|uniref:Unplaced genomic scaffold CY34scaffold_115, whole genome shotgun sequence n=1 Tax=Suillus luteus UH-Slu-Lm8-n1 TaxID=930992 RepID=A0A0C9ZWH5_9AGAM|nr:hypothetical protein CY34DRAFT_805216 [Suillus luteus UH-Slu-Lm8-n1]